MKSFLIFLFFSRVSLTIPTNGKDYSMMKEINGTIYIGGRNSLSAYKLSQNKLKLEMTETYQWPIGIMNGSDIGYNFYLIRWPSAGFKNPSSLAFDTCLNWKQEHSNISVRNTSFDYQHWQYHTPSGVWDVMNFTCMNSFIRAVEVLDNETLWVCGTFGAFPRAFSVSRTTLKFIEFVDVNMMSCARYMDEPMATYRDRDNNLYVASGWGLYRPDKKDPDIPDNNSTMLYADWRLYRNLFTLPSAMAWVLSSDVNFINVVKETDDHLYFFGHEINNQYGLNNQEDRHAWQSFLLRICKTDLGFKYVPTEIPVALRDKVDVSYYTGRINGLDYKFSPIHEDMAFNEQWYHKTLHLPTRHFVNSQKINFGCYVGKRPRAISDNYYWGETNVVYLNKLVDVIFDPNKKIKFKTKNNERYFGCNNEHHFQTPLIGLFNRPGIEGVHVSPTGALCQMQINQNIFPEEGTLRGPYHIHNILAVQYAFQEIMGISLANFTNFYSRSMYRGVGYSLYPYTNQGVLMRSNNEYKEISNYIGKCFNESFYRNLDYIKFLEIQKLSNTAWPNELPNRLSSIPSAICQYSTVELYSFNATFVVPDVEFKRIFLISENNTNYFMHKLQYETEEKRRSRLKTSPLIVAVIISSSGILYRVVLCDFDSAMENHGEDKTSDTWYNWCIFRHTDQPYLYRQYTPMESREWGESYQYRASSLLMRKQIVKKEDILSSPTNKDPQFHVVKEVLRKGSYLFVVTANMVYTVDIKVECNAYRKCIDCASDPYCMWQVSDNRCTQYDSKLFSSSLFVQDVLDRGFRCASTKMYEKNIILDASVVMAFNCSNAGFWRGRIVWKRNGIEIDFGTSETILIHSDNTIMHLIDNSGDKYGRQIISCHGVKEDHDRLFRGADYDWSLTTSDILLNNFTIKPVIIHVAGNSWHLVGIVFISITIILLILAVSLLLFKSSWWNKVYSSKSTANHHHARKDNNNRPYPNPKEAALNSTICLRSAWD